MAQRRIAGAAAREKRMLCVRFFPPPFGARIQFSDGGKIAQRHPGDKDYQQDYPPHAAHEVGHFRTESEGARRRIPVEEEVGVIVAAAEVPIQRITYAGKDEIVYGRDQRKGEHFERRLPVTAEEKVYYRRQGDHHMREHVCRRFEAARQSGCQHAAKHNARERDGYREHEFDDVQRARYDKTGLAQRDDVQNRKNGARCAYPQIGLHGEIQKRRAARHKIAAHLRGERNARNHAGGGEQFQQHRRYFNRENFFIHIFIIQ